jgi:hypothetical protein
VKLKRKINLAKWQKKNQKNEDQNWHKKYKKYSNWRVKLKRIINFTKEPREKLEIKTMRTKLENIIPSIWIEGRNW